MKSPRRRWVCPCCSNTVLAPGRMRKDNALRYCLTCTAETGKLVERTCPALDRRRKVAARRDTDRRRILRERERARWTDDGTPNGLDLRVELRRLVRHLSADWTERSGKKRRYRVPDLLVRRGQQRRRFVPGHCWRDGQGYRITMTIHLRSDRADVLSTLAHEVAHLAWMDHGSQFKHGLARLVERAYGVDVYAYADQAVRLLDGAVVAALRRKETTT